MKKKLFAFIITVLLICIEACCVYASDAPRAVKNAAKSAVELSVNTSFGTKTVTAFAVNKGSKTKYLVTNLWAIEGYTGDIIVNSGNDETITATVIATDEVKNIAVLELSDEPDGVKNIKIKVKDAETETEVYTLGFAAKDNEETIFSGNIQSLNLFTSGNMSADIYQVSATVNDTNNGGMLLDKNGNLLGLCFYDGNADINKAITSKTIADVLDNHDISYKKATLLYLFITIFIVFAIIALAVWRVLEFLKNKRENSPMLIGKSGDFRSQRIILTSENICIGRDAKACQVVITNDPKVSRCHCSIHYDKLKNLFVLTDLSSTHGTFINGSKKLEANVPVYLNSGSAFSLGGNSTEFIVSEGGMF